MYSYPEVGGTSLPSLKACTKTPCTPRLFGKCARASTIRVWPWTPPGDDETEDVEGAPALLNPVDGLYQDGVVKERPVVDGVEDPEEHTA